MNRDSRFTHPLVVEGEPGGGRERQRAAGGAAGGRGAGGGTRAAARSARAEDAGQPVPAREAAVLVIAELTLDEASGSGGNAGAAAGGGSAAGSGGAAGGSSAAGRTGDPGRELSREPRRRGQKTTLLRSRKGKGTADKAERGDDRELHLVV